MIFPDIQSEQEYNSLYPYKSEFQAWVDAIESDVEYFEDAELVADHEC